MAKPKTLATMSLDALVKLRDDVTEILGKQAVALQEQLARLTDLGTGRKSGRVKGRRVAVKYRDKNGNAWSGRGAQPRWMTAAIKAGAKRDDFLVEKVAKIPARKAKKSAKRAKPTKRAKVAKKRAKPARPGRKLVTRPKMKASKPAKRPNRRTRAKTETAKQVNRPIPQPQPKTDDVPTPASA